MRWYRRWKARLDPKEHFYWRMQAVIVPELQKCRAGRPTPGTLSRIEHQWARLQRLGWAGRKGGWAVFLP